MDIGAPAGQAEHHRADWCGYIYGAGVPKSMPAGVFANGLFDYFKSEPFNAHYDGGVNKKMPQEPGAWKAWEYIKLLMGTRQGQVRFDLLWDKQYGIRLRIECNPRKLGPKGFKQLAKVLGGPNAPFDLSRLVKAARLTRLDICVDVVGMRMWELMLWHTEQGTRSHYLGSDGALETVYVHRKPQKSKAKAKASSPRVPAVLLKAYDRVRLKQAEQKPPPFQPAPVLRVEWPFPRFIQRPLTCLLTLDDKLKDSRAGFVQSQSAKSILFWVRYIAARRSMSEQEAVTLLGIQPQMAEEFRALEKVPVPDLVSSKEVWPYWKVGLAHTGLLGFLDAK